VELPEFNILVTEEQIKARIPKLAEEITSDMGDKNPLIVVVLKGAFMFAADLVKCFEFPFEMDFISISSYGDAATTSGVVKLLKDLDKPIKGRTVLLLEDIVDTGLTLHYLLRMFEIREPERIEVAAFLSKDARREYDIDVKYVGFDIPDDFVVGYGLDYKQQYRGLPYVITINE